MNRISLKGKFLFLVAPLAAFLVLFVATFAWFSTMSRAQLKDIQIDTDQNLYAYHFIELMHAQYKDYCDIAFLGAKGKTAEIAQISDRLQRTVKSWKLFIYREPYLDPREKPRELKLVAALQVRYNNLAAAGNRVIDLSVKGRRDQALNVLAREVIPEFKQVEDSVVAISVLHRREIQNNVSAMLVTLQFRALLNGLLFIAVIAALWVIYRFLYLHILTPIAKLEKAAVRLRGGDMGVHADVDSQDEIGMLAKAFNAMVDRNKSMFDQLSSSEKKYKSLTEHINIGVVFINQEMCVVAINRCMRAWFPHVDFDKEPVCHKAFGGKCDNGMCTPSCPVQSSFDDAGIHEETIELDVAGKPRNFHIVASPVKDDSGKVVGAIEMFEDITEKLSNELELENYRRHLEELVAERTAKLQKAEKTKDEFISTVSHELRTPLTAIKEGIGIVYDGSAGAIGDQQKHFLEMAKRNVDRLGRLINDVLDFQKLQAGKIEFSFEESDFNAVVKEAVRSMTPAAQSKDLDIILEVGQMPLTAFDRDKITQVIINLISNAIKFTEKGVIKVSTVENEGLIVVAVADTGSGIKEEDKTKLFNAFSQIDSGNTRKTGGTGLGLAISKEIIEGHGGRIWVESEFGKGSKFFFSLPVAR